jgi:hypothetical protein
MCKIYMHINTKYEETLLTHLGTKPTLYKTQKCLKWLLLKYSDFSVLCMWKIRSH